MADLTRFDFHALRFLKSENVEVMTAEEVGQYLLLMIHAWLGKKDASLPDTPELLARWAKVKEVSPLVLSMFPVVETRYGLRRQNETLFEEWKAALGRSTDAVETGRLGGSVTSEAKAEAARRNGLLGGRPSFAPEANETQATQAQTKPNQTEPITSTPGQSRFANLSARYRKHFGVAISTHKKAKNEYAVACLSYGEDTVLAMFDAWASEPGNQWIREKRHPYGMKAFYEQLNEQIAAQQGEKAPEDSVNRETVQAIIKAQKNETEALLAAKREEEAAIAKADSWF